MNTIEATPSKSNLNGLVDFSGGLANHSSNILNKLDNILDTLRGIQPQEGSKGSVGAPPAEGLLEMLGKSMQAQRYNLEEIENKLDELAILIG